MKVVVCRPDAPWPSDETVPRLEVLPCSTRSPRGCVLVCPGGGYGGRAPHEAAPVAQRFAEAGMAAAVVHYQTAPHRHPAPFRDVTHALRQLRQSASDWGIDPGRIAVLGFSAGGHLAASVGVHWQRAEFHEPGTALEASRPNALILCYPVISAGDFGHRGSFGNLLGPSPNPDLLDLMSLENQVSETTPPAFLWHTADDQPVPVENSLAFAAALARHQRPFELHVYPHGHHGLGLATAQPHIATWSSLAIEWLQGMGW